MKKFISIILTMIMTFSTIAQGYCPYENSGTTANAVDVSTVSSEFDIKGNGSLGNLLSNEFKGISEVEDNDSDSKVYGIYDVEINGSTANITYHANSDALLLVAVYTEDGSRLLAKGTHEIKYDNINVNAVAQVTLTGDIPEYFLVKAFILDKNQMPLCDEYTSNMYTKEITKLRESDIHDYDSEFVVNLDESEETNFLVLDEEINKVEYNAETNILVSADEINRIYVFDNCDESLKNMKAGEIFYYDYNKENFFTIKIQKIEMAGDTITIYGDESLEIDEVFEIIKIEETLSLEDAEDESDMKVGTDIGYGMVYEGMTSEEEYKEQLSDKAKAVLSPNKRDSEHTASINIKEFEWNYNSDEEKNTVEFGKVEGSVKGEVHAKIGASIEIKLKLYKVGLIREAGSLTVSPQIHIDGEFTITAEVKYILSEWKWKTFFDLIEFSEEFAFVVSGEINGSINGTISFLKMTFTVGDDSKKFLKFDLIDFEGEAKVETEFYIGLELALKAKVLDCELSGNAKGGLQIETVLISSKNDKTDEYIHDCDKCIASEIYIVYSYDFSEKNNKGEHTSNSTGNGIESKYKFLDFYWSISNSEFGFGYCPNNYHKTVIKAVTGAGKPIPNAKVTGFTDHNGNTSAITDSEGKAILYLKPGLYKIKVTANLYDTEMTKNCNLDIANGSQSINLDFIPEKLPVSITVIDETGKPISNVAVSSKTKSSLVGDDNTYTANGVTDNNGKVILNISTVPSSGTTVTITDSATGLSKHDYPLYFSEDNLDFVFKLSENESSFVDELITVTIVDKNGNKVPNAIVELGEVDYSIILKDDQFYPAVSSTTNSEGQAKLFMPSHTYINTIRISVPDYAELISDFELEEGVSSYTFELNESGIGNNTPPANVVDSGTCGAQGDNLTWTLDSEGTLIISGEGEMADWDYDESPWYSNEKIINVVIENGVTSIGDGAFTGCSSLTSITIPDSVTSIGNYAFESCRSLTSITIPDSVTSIGNYAFESCRSLTSITIPDSVTSIGEGVFEYCLSLTSITIPDSVTSIGSGAFMECYGLTSITIPDSVTSIGNYAFYECYSLTSITIPDSVTSIGNYAFESCRSLTSITIPISVTNIGEEAFYGCPYLSDVYYAGTKDDWNAITIEDYNYDLTNATIHYNSSMLGNSVTKIEDKAFAACPSITDVYFKGTEEQWNKIEIHDFNSGLTEANIHFNSTGNEIVNKAISLNSVNIMSDDTSDIQTYTYSEAVPNTDYILIATKNTDNPLSTDNLLYIDQQTADENGKVEFSYIVPEECAYIFIGDFGKGEYCRVVSDSISTDANDCTICSANDNNEQEDQNTTTTTPTTTQSTTTTTATTTKATTTTTTAATTTKATTTTTKTTTTTTKTTTTTTKATTTTTTTATTTTATTTTTTTATTTKATTTTTTTATTTTITTSATTTVTTTSPPIAVPTYTLGDVNEDGAVDSSDASLVLAEYAKIQTGGAGELTEVQKLAADVNKDGTTDSSDASKILAYYAMISTGKEPSWD